MVKKRKNNSKPQPTKPHKPNPKPPTKTYQNPKPKKPAKKNIEKNIYQQQQKKQNTKSILNQSPF